VLLAHRYAITERVALKFDANIINLFNQAAVTSVTTRLNRNGNLSTIVPDPYGGYDAAALIPVSRKPTNINPATGAAWTLPFYNPIYNLPSGYQGNREIRLGVHLEF
jgi:hypothetical protein